MTARNRLCELFGIELPVLQAPMAGSSDLAMALQVAKAGGLGSLALAGTSPDAARESLQAFQERSSSPINVNFFAHNPPIDDPAADQRWLSKLSGYFAELGITAPEKLDGALVSPFDAARAEVIEEFKPAVVSFHFGLPAADLVARIKAVGCKIISSATTVQEAIWLEAQGCDAVIAQGLEAGGHRGLFLDHDLTQQIGTFSLVPQIVDAISVPVIAAGGIADQRGVRAAFALGASAVQVGTAYLFTREAAISPACRKALAATKSEGTAVSNVFSGRPSRVATNRFVREQGPISPDAPAFPKGFLTSGPLRAASEKQEESDIGAYFCGQSAPMGCEVTAYELTKTLGR